MPATIDNITKSLGDKADFFLNHKCTTIAKERLHLPGPDFVDRIFGPTNRNNRVLNNLRLDDQHRPPRRHGLPLHPARGPGHRALRRRELRQKPGLF